MNHGPKTFNIEGLASMCNNIHSKNVLFNRYEIVAYIKVANL